MVAAESPGWATWKRESGMLYPSACPEAQLVPALWRRSAGTKTL